MIVVIVAAAIGLTERQVLGKRFEPLIGSSFWGEGQSSGIRRALANAQ
jgi:hypothetical protein